MRVDAEGQVAEHLRPEPITQAHIFEPDHVPLRCRGKESRGRSAVSPVIARRPGPTGDAQGSPDMVSASLTDRRYAWRSDIADSPMLIACPNCATSYQVEPSSLGNAGRSVRCVRCRHAWFVGNTEPASSAATPAAVPPP